jgi:RNA recognition motif-containing protein
MDIYVGNLPFNTTEDELEAAFGAYGDVNRVKIVSDRETGRSRGFAFVSMDDAAAAGSAIEALNETDFQGRTLRVREAEDRRPQQPRRGPPRGERSNY